MMCVIARLTGSRCIGLLTLGMLATACAAAPAETSFSESADLPELTIPTVASDAAPHVADTTRSGLEPVRPAIPLWEALDAHDELRSGHLWIVNRAIGLLAAYGDPRARKVTSLMRDPTCQAAWHQGLIDADYVAEYNGGRSNLKPGYGLFGIARTQASWQAHFFDPDTGKNYKGGTDTAFLRALTYHEAAVQLLSCESDSCATTRDAVHFAGTDQQKGCYALGLSIHFAADISQPMHAALFTAADFPIKQHTHVEEYALANQHQYALTEWSPSPSPTLVADILMNGARSSKALWPEMKASLSTAYGNLGCSPMEDHWFDETRCWEGDPAVADAIGRALALGQQLTSDVLYALTLP